MKIEKEEMDTTLKIINGQQYTKIYDGALEKYRAWESKGLIKIIDEDSNPKAQITTEGREYVRNLENIPTNS